MGKELFRFVIVNTLFLLGRTVRMINIVIFSNINNLYIIIINLFIIMSRVQNILRYT